MPKLISLFGLVVFVLIAVLFSENKKHIHWRLVGWGLGLQLVFALLILRTDAGLFIFSAANLVMTGILSFTAEGSRFLFGSLVDNTSIGAIMAFGVLPVIIFTSALMAVLYYFRVIQFIVKIMAWVMHRTMQASGAESLTAGLFVFMGIEAITAVRPYIQRMTRSELFTVMCAFLSTIAGSVMAIYVSFGAQAGHLLAASVMSAPAAVVMAKILVPETDNPVTAQDARLEMEMNYHNPVEAASDGAIEGGKLALNIAAMLIAFVSLIALLNYPLGLIHLSLEKLLGFVFMPFAWLMGVPWSETPIVGELLGVKVILTEFLSFVRLQELIAQSALSARSIVVSTYALCGFTSIVSVAIMIGGLAGIAPRQKPTVVSLSLRALLGGMLANFMTATIAGILL